MRIAFALVGLLVATPVLAKDLIVRQRSATGLAGTTPREETVYLAGTKVVTDSPAMRTIVDLDARTITAIDKTKRIYTVTTFDELKAQMEAVRAAMERMPPEARARMGWLLDEGPPVTLKPTGKTDTIAGYPAKEYAIAGGPYGGAVWTTDAIPTPPEFQRWKTIEQSSGVAQGPGRRLGEAMSTLSGFPLRSRIEAKTGPQSQSFVVSTEVLEVKDGSAPKEMVEVPSGFTRRQPPPPNR